MCILLLVLAIDKLFSGEEGGGRFLDLHELHTQYINLKDVKRISYLVYLEQVHRLDLIPRHSKNNTQYRR
jgi:splicing factor 3A subunit 3